MRVSAEETNDSDDNGMRYMLACVRDLVRLHGAKREGRAHPLYHCTNKLVFYHMSAGDIFRFLYTMSTSYSYS